MKEKIYDEQINPLMAQIIKICTANNIAFIADFGLEDDLHCTSANVSDVCEPSDAQMKAWQLLKPKRSFAMAETIETLPDGSKKISLRRIS